MTSKERVRLNLYKRMLEEERKKNKRLKTMVLSVFVVGVFSFPVYDVYNHGGIIVPGQLGTGGLQNSVSMKNKRINLEQVLEDEIFAEKQFDISEDELLSELSI